MRRCREYGYRFPLNGSRLTQNRPTGRALGKDFQIAMLWMRGELSFLEQLIGNVGRVSTDQLEEKTGGR